MDHPDQKKMYAAKVKNEAEEKNRRAQPSGPEKGCDGRSQKRAPEGN